MNIGPMHFSIHRLRTLILIAFLCNVFLKSIFITSTPPVVTDDEMYYATEAQSILVSGSDISGTWRPWQLRPANPIYSELTGLTYLPGFVLFPQSPQIAMKVVPIFLGSLLPILLALIVYKFFAQKIYFVATVVVATLNPWIFQFSRMSFDSLPSVFFYCLGVVCVLYLRGWKKVIALLPFFMGFYQYQGHKLMLLPILLLTILYSAWPDIQKISWRRPTFPWGLYKAELLLVISCCLLVAVYLFRLSNQTSTRVGEVAINSDQLASQVDTDRRFIFENPFLTLFTNKFVELASLFFRRFVETFDLTWLFVHGNEHVDTFAVTTFGFLYPIDAVLTIIALIFLWSSKKYRAAAVFLTSLVIVGTIPSVVKNASVWLTFRAAFTIVGLLLLSVVGAVTLWQRRSRIIRISLIAVYALFAIGFYYHYFFSYPILSTKNLSFYNRVVASYMKRQPENKFLLYANKTVFDSILVYNNLITKESIGSLNETYRSETYALGNIQLAHGCFDPEWAATQSATILVDYRTGLCENAHGPSIATPSGKISFIAIGSLTDSLSEYYIYNDNLCREAQLTPYLSLKKNKFNLEMLSDKDFCETFFSNPGKIDSPKEIKP